MIANYPQNHDIIWKTLRLLAMSLTIIFRLKFPVVMSIAIRLMIITEILKGKLINSGELVKQ